MKKITIFLLFLSVAVCNLQAQLCNSGRADLSSLSSTQQTQLNNLIKQYLATGAPSGATTIQQFPIIWEHMRPGNFPNIHTTNITTGNVGTDFLDWHRYYINELENWLLANGGAEFVPLPYWDPEDPIPSAFAGNSSLVDPNVTFSGNTLASIHSGHSTNVANQVNLNDVMVDNSSDCSSWATADDFANAAEFGNGNHNAVHNAIGGIMSGHYSPSSTIFWCWHAYVDDLWLCYQKYCAPGNVDAMVRDCVGDDGTEPSPNPPCDKLWKSPDIWVRNSADGFTNQQNQTLFQTSFDNTAYVYVRVWNVGDLPVTPGDVDLDLYWANASTGLSWPNPWNGSTLNCGGNNVPMGGTIANNLQITRISEPYQQSNVTPTVDTEPYIIVEAVWTIPDPDHYTSCFTNQWEAEHFCVLAILDDGNPVNPSPFYSGLRNYNNMALKNVTIVGDGQQMIVVNDPHDECVLIANHSRRPMEDVTLTLEMEGRNNVLEVADVFFDLEPVALELWNQGGRKGQNVRMHRDGRIQLTGDGAALQGIALQPNQISNLCLTFVPTQATGETFEFDIVQRNGEEVIGGETFLIEGITDRATIDKRSSGQQQVLQSKPMQSYVYPNPASEFIRYEVLDGNQLSQLSLYDIQGRLVLSKFAQDDYGRIPVTDQARGTYLLKLVFKDGSFETHKVILK